MTVTSTGGRPSWQFSLRELLLLLTAIGSLLALAIKSYPAQLSPFIRQFDPCAELQAVLQKQGVSATPAGSGGGLTFSRNRGQRRWEVAWHQDQVNWQQDGRLFAAIRDGYAKRIEDALKTHGCAVHRLGNGMTNFSRSYQRGAMQGEFVTEFVDLGGGNFKVYAFCYEYRGW